jgi:uncharacterized membrane protein/mono/diheme cytochrome c family protein
MRALLVILIGLALAIILTSASAFAASPDAERGHKIMRARGCGACHSSDGTARVGPTFRGLWGRTRPVNANGDVHDVLVDEAYVARALREPDSEIAAGYPRGNMPRFDATDDDVRAVAAALRELDAVPRSSTERGGSILPLVIAAAAFAGMHFLLSSIPVRKRLIGALKQGGFSGLYSVIVLASFGAMIWFYRTAPYIEVWSPPRWTRWVPVLVMPVALLFLVTGFSAPNPTAVAQGAHVKKDGPPRGIQAVTRHPALWGFAIWALGHLATNGELHVMLVAASILVLAFGGMMHIDARRRHELGEDWAKYTAKSSLVPLAAILQGRAKLRLGEIGFVRVLIVAFVYVALLHTHALIIGASPFP